MARKHLVIEGEPLCKSDPPWLFDGLFVRFIGFMSNGSFRLLHF